jgi:predicted XRE-type DNA-binding protein
MDDQCREWPGARDENGYGRIRYGGRWIGVHRFVWIAAHGEIPEGMMVLHYCDNPPCFRLDHLRLGTHADNMSDRQLAGHYEGVHGEANGKSKLTASDVLEIRRLRAEEGWFQQRIADHFGIGQPQVSAILRRQAWDHI